MEATLHEVAQRVKEKIVLAIESFLWYLAQQHQNLLVLNSLQGLVLDSESTTICSGRGRISMENSNFQTVSAEVWENEALFK
jgi:hypothetical protein